MKKWMWPPFLSALLLLAQPAQAQSCCSSGGGAGCSVLPGVYTQMAGLRFVHSRFSSVYPQSLIPEKSGQRANEHLYHLEAFARFNVWQRLQVLAFLPLERIERMEAGKTTVQQGVADVSLMLQYGLFSQSKFDGQALKHQLRFGAGVKLPSGKFRYDSQSMFATNLQTGSGSTDVLLQIQYTLRKGSWGLNAWQNTRLNTENRQGFRFGHQMQYALQTFYWYGKGSLGLMPSAGFTFTQQLPNFRNQKKLTFTGLELLHASIGLDVYWRSFIFTSAFQPRVWYKLNWSGEQYNLWRLETGLYYQFSFPEKTKKQKQKK